MEAHERLVQAIREFSGDGALVHLCGHGIVDVQKRHRFSRQAGSDVFGQRAVNIHLARYAIAHRRQPRIDIARHKSEFRLERRPALVRHHNVFRAAAVCFNPVHQRQLVLRKPRQHAGHPIALAEFLFHFANLFRNAFVALVLTVGDEQIQLRILLNVHAQLNQRRNRRVAGVKVRGARTERNDLELLQPQHCACDRHEFKHHFRAFLRRANRIFGDIRAHAVELQIVARVQHSAVRVAAIARKHVDRLLGGGNEHHGTAEFLRQQHLGMLGTEISQIHDPRVHAGAIYVVQRVDHI